MVILTFEFGKIKSIQKIEPRNKISQVPFKFFVVAQTKKLEKKFFIKKLVSDLFQVQLFFCFKKLLYFSQKMPEIPFAHQWQIEENELLPLKNSVNGRLFSTSVTNIPEFEYYLSIYPNGDIDERRGQTWIFLELEFKNVKKVEADFTIESSKYSQENHYVYEETEGWGNGVCLKRELFNPEKKYIVDGKLTVKINGIFKFERTDDAPAAIGDGQQKWIGGELGDKFWERNDNKDFSIITDGGKEIKIHKLVLDIRSEVFTAMLNSNMKESNENKVTITDFSFNVVETALKIIYDCNFNTTLSIDELMGLLQFFDKYLLPELKAKVEPFLIAKTSASTVVRLTNCSVQTNSFKLKEKCMQFLMASFAAKTPLPDFDDLDKDTVFDIIKNSLYGTLETEEQ